MPRSSLTNQAYALITLYSSEYEKKYERAPVLNRYREKWGFQSMIEDLGYEKAREVIRYYFTTKRIGHPLSHLLFNYDKLSNILDDLAEDEVKRTELREQTQQRVEEWERMNGN